MQPDVTRVGGLSEARRIAWMADENGVRLIPHGWNTAIGLAADLQLASPIAGTDLVEHIIGSPYVGRSITDPWTLDEEGMLSIPAGPGLGVTLGLDAVSRYTAADVRAWVQIDRSVRGRLRGRHKAWLRRAI